MRIISGERKGKKILQPKDKLTRPLKDLAKESIFNIIQHSKKFSVKLEKSLILDLFSGVGSFGIECLSRKAAFVIFIENYKEVLPILKKNINNLNYSNFSSVIETDIFNQLIFKSLNSQFDIIFIDPPFKEKNLNKLLNEINISEILNKNGIIIVHRHKKEEDDLPNQFKIIEKKIYGISKIIFGRF